MNAGENIIQFSAVSSLNCRLVAFTAGLYKRRSTTPPPQNGHAYEWVKQVSYELGKLLPVQVRDFL